MNKKQQLLLGRAGSGKSYFCLEKAREYLQRGGERMIFLLPNLQMIHHVERQLVETADLPGLQGQVLYQFSNLWNEIRLHTGNLSSHKISDEEKRYILQHIVSKSKLEYLNNASIYPGFITSLIRLIRELKQNLISPEDLRNRVDSLPAGALFELKAKEISRLYCDYNKFLRQKELVDKEDIGREALEAIDSNDKFFARFDLLVMDGFSSFTRLEFELLKKLIGSVKEVIIVLCHDRKDSAVFEIVEGTYRQLRALCQWEEVELAGNRRASGALAHIEANLFHEKVDPAAADDSIRIIQASSIAAEVETVAREIKKQVAEEGLRFSDMAVLLRTTDEYAPFIMRVFDRFRIPYCIDFQEKLRDVPFIKAARMAIKLAATSFDPDNFLSLMKSGYLKFDPTIAAQLQNYMLKYGLRKEEKWRKDWREDEDFPSDIIDRMNQAKAGLFDTLDRWRAPLADGPNAEVFERVVLDIIKQLMFSNGPSVETAKWNLHFHQCRKHAVENLKEILKSIKNHYSTLASKSIKASEFFSKVEDSLRDRKFSLPPVGEDFVHVCNVYQSRLPEYKMVFVMGLEEKIFPKTIRNDPFFKDRERQKISGQHKLRLPGVLGRSKEERYLFYIACTRCTDKLYLTCHTADFEGNEVAVSHYLDEIKKLFTAESLEPRTRILPVGSVVPSAEDHVSSRDIQNYLAQKLWHSLTNKADTEPMFHLYNTFFSGDDRLRAILIEGLRHQSVELSKKTVDRLRQKRYWMSISQLETYGECPFRYFVENVLKIESRAEMEFGPIEEGGVLHSVLQHLMTKIYQKRETAIESILVEELFTDLGQLIDQHIAKRCGGMLETARTRVQRNRIVHTLCAFLYREQANQRQNQTMPSYFELAFGKPREDEAQDEKSVKRVLEIDCGEGLSLFLAGRIDRVDILQQTGEEFGVIIDYKRGDRGKIYFEDGDSLQCPLYMLALDRIFGIKAVGSFYYSINNGRKRGLYDKKFQEKIEGVKDIYNSEGFSSDELKRLIEINTSIAIDRVKAIRDGRFPVSPRANDTCRYCTCRMICRR